MEAVNPVEAAQRAAAHRARLAPYVEPHLARRARGERHPVHDFMFEYYPHRPGRLLRWHEPSADPGVALALVRAIHRLLVATAGREGAFGCFGLHEWAMVYRLAPDATRHAWPLRLGAEGSDAVVEGHRVQCTHFDAFRFFTPDAVPLNRVHPGRDDRPDFEQPGCLHATMDLYKHAFRLGGLVPAELVADAFALAWDVRIADMRAAPYDLTGVRLDPTGEPWTPIRIETPEGKREYADLQRGFAERARPVRAALIECCERALDAASLQGGDDRGEVFDGGGRVDDAEPGAGPALV